ncbi:MAG TPA: glycosyltransferase family 9 protein [Candidatus Brocadiia bacterium]|nr:glycosyltransferase family 9 protein [Candidatus Brocadiia bacterium]
MNKLGPGPRVVIHPGASPFGRFKRWPAERFGLVARELARRAGAKVIVIHGPSEEQEMLDKVLAASEGTAILAPAFTLPQLVALLREVNLFIGADSGPLHVAALAGAACVAIFGPKNPAVYAPPNALIVRRDDLPCSPCAKRSCDNPRCLLDIPAEQVLQAALQALAPSPTTQAASAPAVPA